MIFCTTSYKSTGGQIFLTFNSFSFSFSIPKISKYDLVFRCFLSCFRGGKVYTQRFYWNVCEQMFLTRLCQIFSKTFLSSGKKRTFTDNVFRHVSTSRYHLIYYIFVCTHSPIFSPRFFLSDTLV